MVTTVVLKLSMEFERQGDKIAKAIVSMDADIVGLMEIETMASARVRCRAFGQ